MNGSRAARVMDGHAVAAEVGRRISGEIRAAEEALGREPALAAILVGDDPASRIYIERKRKACAEACIHFVPYELDADTLRGDLEGLIRELNGKAEVDGILLQLPLPGHLDADAMTSLIAPEKDVDGLTPVNAGLLAHGTPGIVPATAAGVMELLRSADVTLAGSEAVVVGRSKLVGVPTARLLLMEDATVTLAHSETRELEQVCRRADILVSAAGVPSLIGPRAVKDGAVVIDVGINHVDGRLVGDVDFDAVSRVASAITPVPGGVGPMTIAMLLANTVTAASARAV
jgi:methylenetetrahydrofolate dehydrogenase (NADP+) / methenyltetrahydrofolate cyclohydrolase